MRVINCVQGDPEWLHLRCGRVTSSKMADVLATRKDKKEAAPRANLRIELVAERLTGVTTENFVSRWMEEGKEKEPLARAEYEIRTDTFVDLVGFVLHDRIELAGASPDGLVGSEGCVEFKAPKLTTHIQYWLDGVIPAEYEPQMMWQMACTGRQWCDFVSFHPDLPEKMQLFIKRLPRDDKRIAAMEEEVERFLGEVELALNAIKTKLDPVKQFQDSIAMAEAKA